MFLTSDLKPGDVLLYKGQGFYSKLIFLKTWHEISHVEVFLGDVAEKRNMSTASRDGQGVGIYPVREDISYVLRPNVPFNKDAALEFALKATGTPYGWWDLLQFIGLDINTDGIVCSPYATYVERTASVNAFKNEKPEKIAPKDFLLSELYDVIYSPLS